MSPAAAHANLEPRMTRQGVEVDVGSDPEGVWFDEGEILFFARDRRRLGRRLSEAAADSRPSDRMSPRSGQPMRAFELDGVGTILTCEQTGGLWLDAPVLKALVGAPEGLRFDLIEPPKAEPMPRVPGGVILRRVPSLAARSIATLLGLYLILGLALITAVEFLGLSLNLMLLIGVGGSLLHFLLGPWLMDLSLNWLYRIDWVETAELPDHLSGFVTALAAAQGIKEPRFGVLDDGAPQAFTYGHTPNNARIVLSRGLFELLEPDEVEAVVAHEVGHAVHWDMFLMTVAQLVPMLLYYVYRALARSMKASRSGSRKGDIRPFIMLGAYLLYIVSQYVVLWFSRTRELHADRFSGEATGRPGALSSALVKIAYGLAGQEQPADTDKEATQRNPRLEAVKAMGIFDAGTARNLVMAAYGGTTPGADGMDPTLLKSAMRWDLWNPWAKWFELNSTHPLTARRLDYLANQSEAMGQKPFVRFDLEQPESYWDEFLVDLFLHQLPTIAALAVLAVAFLPALLPGTGAALPGFDLDRLLGALGLAVGVALQLRHAFSYPSKGFDNMTVAALLKKVKVSAVRPVPCRVKGTVIGRGVPGLIYSEDFVLRDPTGIIFLDLRQPLRIWELFFGLLRRGQFDDKVVTVVGWYRRAPVPFIEIRYLTCDGKTTKSWLPGFNLFLAIAIAVAGLAVLLLRPFASGVVKVAS